MRHFMADYSIEYRIEVEGADVEINGWSDADPAACVLRVGAMVARLVVQPP